MNQEQLTEFLINTYEKVTGPLPVVGSAMDLAESYRKPDKDVHSCVDSLIKWQCSKTATSGFISGLGGFLTLPVAIPADLAQSLYIQLRMVAAIGHLYDYDVHSDKVRTLCFASLCGGSAAEILSNAGIKIGQKIAHNLIKSISRETIIVINKKVGFRLLTKFGTTGVVNLGKCIPFFGGGVGAIMNL